MYELASAAVVNPSTGHYVEPENWKPLTGFETRYQISDLGNVFDLHTRRHVPFYFDNGKPKILIDRGANLRPYRLYIHQAVALAFLPNPDGLPWVVRRNSNKRDCRASNLMWAPAFSKVPAERPVRLPVVHLSGPALLPVLDDSMNPTLPSGSRLLVEPADPGAYTDLIGSPVAIVVKADRLAFYLGRLVSIDEQQVTVSRDNADWQTRTEPRSVIASLARIVSLTETPIH